MIPTVNRRLAREHALQFLFQEEFLNSENLKSNLLIFKDNFNLDDQTYKFVEELVLGIKEHQTPIDSLISQNLKNWSLDRISNIDKNILRISIFETQYKTKDPVPFKSSINEAIEIAKRFGNTESSRFINGILDQIHKKPQ